MFYWLYIVDIELHFDIFINFFDYLYKLGKEELLSIKHCGNFMRKLLMNFPRE